MGTADAASMSSRPPVDLACQHRQIADEVTEGFTRILAETSFMAVVPSSSPSASPRRASVRLLRCCRYRDRCSPDRHPRAGMGAGDDVVRPANTFVGTAEAVVGAGAGLVLAMSRMTRY